jgi:hypothetical protein
MFEAVLAGVACCAPFAALLFIGFKGRGAK